MYPNHIVPTRILVVNMEDRIVNVNVTFYTYLYSVINKAGRVSAKSNNSRSADHRVIHRVSNLRFLLSKGARSG